MGWGLWDGREQKVGFAEKKAASRKKSRLRRKKLRLCLAGLPCMAMPVQVGALRGGRKILRPYKWEEIEGTEGVDGVEG